APRLSEAMSDHFGPSPPTPANVRVVTSLPPDDHRFSIADDRTIRALSAAEDRHFWHLSRNALIEARLRALGMAPPARVLELGCGGGCVAAHLARVGFSITGVYGHLPRGLEAAARTRTAEFIVHDLGQGIEALDMPQDFDVVGLFDVIEHLELPRDTLEYALGCARPGGLVVGTVPALMSLWSRLDEYVGHRL